MSDTFPAVPSDQLLESVDLSFAGDYSKIWRGVYGIYHQDGRIALVVSLSNQGDVHMEALTAGCLGRTLGCDQAVWVASAVEHVHPVPEPWLVMAYTDRWGTQSLRRRRVSIDDFGRVVGAGMWETRPTEGSRLLHSVGVAWDLEPGDPEAIRKMLEFRGHVVRIP